MATQDIVSEEVIVPDEVDESIESVVETPVDEHVEEHEPEPDEFDDPAEYRKKLKEWGAKEREAILRAEHEKEKSAIINDLRKQREAKRELRKQFEAQQNLIAQYQQANQPELEEPDEALFGNNTKAYAKAYAAYELATREMQMQKVAQQRKYEQAQEQETAEEWNYRMSASLTEQQQQEVAQAINEGVGKYIDPNAVKTIMGSNLGTEILHFLTTHRDICEAVEDLEPRKQIAAIREIERTLIRNPKIAQPVVAPKREIKQEVETTVPVKPSVPTPPSTKNGSANTGTKTITGTKSMEEYMKLRAIEKKNKRW